MRNDRKSRIEATLATLTQFLEEQRISDGDYLAELEPGDREELATIIAEIIKLKFEEDADGALPLEVQIVDKRNYRCIYPICLPHSPDADQLEMVVSEAASGIHTLADELKRAAILAMKKSK